MSGDARALFRATKRRADPATEALFGAEALPVQRKARASRVAHDFYATMDPDPIRALLAADGDRIRSLGAVWEPACGSGDLVREIRAAGIPCSASDLIDRGCPDSWTADFFSCLRSRGGSIITNPPYNLINGRDSGGRWLRHTLDMPDWRYAAFLLNWDWPAARANGLGQLLDDHPFTRAYLMRWKVDFTGEGSPPQRNAWFIWDRDDRRELPAYPPDFRWLDRPTAAPGQTTLQLED